MSWHQTDPMHERHKFIAAYTSGLYTVSELADRFGISRKTAHKWINRYKADGSDGLIERGRAPQHCPHRVSDQIEEIIVAVRTKHPHWGARTLRQVVVRTYPKLVVPSPSTIMAILQRRGLQTPARTRAKHPPHPPVGPLRTATAPNMIWCSDFKGEFRLGCGQYCYPLTVSDRYSRYVLECHGLASTATIGVRERFEAIFRAYGLPEVIRSDNGTPFASPGLCRLSRLNVWWTKLGIIPERIMRGHPEQNGQHERMHRTLKADTTRPAAESFAAQQERFDHWRSEYNTERPHQGIDYAYPADLYQPSVRQLPSTLPDPEYAGHCEKRRVDAKGMIRFKGERVFLSEVLEHEQVALEEIDEGIWRILFYTIELGRLDQREFRIF